MTGASYDLRVGGRVWLDGQGWEVAELTGRSVRLIADGRLRTVSITSLIGATEPTADDVQEVGSGHLWVIPSVVLAGLTTKQAETLTARLHTLRQVIEPEPDDSRTLGERYDATATALGVSRRTLERQVARLVKLGPAGLVDARMLQEVRRAVDVRWDSVCLQVLASYTNQSNPTKRAVITRANEEFQRQVPDGKVPSASVAYRRLAELDKGRYTFGAAKQRRSVGNRPTGVLGRLRADRPGQYVLLDSYRMDVFAMEPVTLRWVNTELTVAMDLYDRRVTGLRLRPVAAQSPDVASVLFQTVTPQTWGWAAGSPEGPYSGLPEHLVLGDPGGVLPDTIVVDHGKIYLSEHTRGVCERLGISIQPAIPDKPTDKPALERFFRTLRQSLLEHLPGYKGPDVAARGHNVEGAAFYYVTELEQIIREWVGSTTTPPTPAWSTPWNGRSACRRRRCSTAGSPPPAGSGSPPRRTWSMTSWRWSGAPSSTTASRSTGNATTAPGSTITAAPAPPTAEPIRGSGRSWSTATTSAPSTSATRPPRTGTSWSGNTPPRSTPPSPPTPPPTSAPSAPELIATSTHNKPCRTSSRTGRPVK